jgi:hypothetical protein
MKLFKMVAVCVALVAPLALAKDKKKSGLPTIFSNARYVYVQAEDGDIMKPGLVPERRDWRWSHSRNQRLLSEPKYSGNGQRQSRPERYS